MDNIVSEAQDTMINQLNFGLPETSQYITDRRFVNYFPSGSNIYSGGTSAGNKNIRFYISGDSVTNTLAFLVLDFLLILKILILVIGLNSCDH